MNIEERMQAKKSDEGEQAKIIEFYSQGVAAWFNSALERDKSLLTLSIAGLGVLLALMPTAINSITALIVYYLAIFAFLMCVFSVLVIFQRNKVHIIDVINGKNTPDIWLTLLDHAALWSFIFGVIFCSVIGISSATSTFFEKEKIMATEKNSTTITSKDNLRHDSFNGVADLSFNHMSNLQKSFNNFSQLQPTQSQSTTTSQPLQNSASQPQTSPPSQVNSTK